jgi:hypothetical protein
MPTSEYPDAPHASIFAVHAPPHKTLFPTYRRGKGYRPGTSYLKANWMAAHNASTITVFNQLTNIGQK